MITGDLLLLITVLVAMLNHGRSYRQGPPSSVCQSMMPDHDGVKEQTTASPYNISVQPTAYRDFDITVSLHSPSNTQFKGYMIEMKMISQPDRFFGGFSLLGDGKLMECGTEAAAAVSHSEGANKNGVRFKWMPVDNLGDIRFVATVVKDKQTFWTSIESPVLKYDSNLRPETEQNRNGTTTTKSTSVDDRIRTEGQTDGPNGGSDGGQKTTLPNVQITIFLGVVVPFIL